MPGPLDLLDHLVDGRFHSGGVLGDALGIARTTVWKHVKALEAMGLEVHAVRGRGYRLARPLERLDASRIRRGLDPAPCALGVPVHVLQEVDSTSDWLANHASGAPNGTACLAERQSAGRGRRGRTWSSPFGQHLSLSLLWYLPVRLVSGLSIAMGVAVADACESQGVSRLELKWPNDLVAAQGKVGGVLVDLVSHGAERSRAIVGVGLNVDMPWSMRAAIGQPVSDLNELAGRRVSRNDLAVAVVAALREALARFERDGLRPFRDRFAARDASRDLQVRVEQSGRVSTGRARGINEEGALLLETDDGMALIQTGDVSLRAP
jgi:BirA family biotin operon repressor/biotin-[acetyl-CoA-carboxylase] ligase